MVFLISVTNSYYPIQYQYYERLLQESGIVLTIRYYNQVANYYGLYKKSPEMVRQDDKHYIDIVFLSFPQLIICLIPNQLRTLLAPVRQNNILPDVPYYGTLLKIASKHKNIGEVLSLLSEMVSISISILLFHRDRQIDRPIDYLEGYPTRPNNPLLYIPQTTNGLEPTRKNLAEIVIPLASEEGTLEQLSQAYSYLRYPGKMIDILDLSLYPSYLSILSI